MKVFKFVYTAFAVFGLGVLVLSFSKREEEKKLIETGSITIDQETPPCVQMYYYIEKYAEEYEIPKNYAYGIAYCETRYAGPFQWKYNHAQTSSVGAVGPMQVMLATAKGLWPGKEITKETLKNNIEFNVETSMKLLRRLHDKYGDWKLVFGAYNTGRPMVNGYAINVYNHKL